MALILFTQHHPKYFYPFSVHQTPFILVCVYLCIHVLTGICARVFMCVCGGQGSTLGVLLNYLHLIFIRMSFLLNLELIDLLRHAHQ